MEHRVYTLTAKAIKTFMGWDEAIERGEIETVKEFATLEEALTYFEYELGSDGELYGVE